jgi:WXG100 family type VII secretion target
VGGYSVDPAELQQCDALLGSAAGQARAALARLRAGAGELVGTWHGPAGSAFRLAWEQWLDGVIAMLDALDAMAGMVGASGVEYAATDQAVRSSLAGVTP